MNRLTLPHATKEDLYQTLTTIHLGSDPLLFKALQQAESSHESQRRDDGNNYLTQHIYPVAIEVIHYYQTKSGEERLRPETIAGALLHDVLEDDENMSDTKFREKFGEEVYRLVKPLSKPDYRTYRGASKRDQKIAMNLEYRKIIQLAPHESKIIKFADRYKNICSVHASPKPGKIEDYIRDTEEFYLPLAKEECVYFYERIKARIEILKENIA
ncbi:MAG: HD domain-containing protein [Nanoarchaeota archaeon]|nr:HD domain-containing protein [Nanoarchaeota archaeon]